jgi:hypothetical protein
MAMLRIEVTARRPRDHATAVVDGQRYGARSSAGAIFALCRKLVAAGVPDQTYEVVNTTAPGTVAMRGRSVHAAARLTVEQRDGQTPRLTRFASFGATVPHSIEVRPPMRAEAEGAIQ